MLHQASDQGDSHSLHHPGQAWEKPGKWKCFKLAETQLSNYLAEYLHNSKDTGLRVLLVPGHPNQIKSSGSRHTQQAGQEICLAHDLHHWGPHKDTLDLILSIWQAEQSIVQAAGNTLSSIQPTGSKLTFLVLYTATSVSQPVSHCLADTHQLTSVQVLLIPGDTVVLKQTHGTAHICHGHLQYVAHTAADVVLQAIVQVNIDHLPRQLQPIHVPTQEADLVLSTDMPGEQLDQIIV